MLVLSVLLNLFEKGKTAMLADDFSEMEIVGSAPKTVSKSFSYFSLLAFCGKAQGVTVAGAKYPLENAEIDCDYPYGISNQVMGDKAVVSVKKGRLLLIKVR